MYELKAVRHVTMPEWREIEVSDVTLSPADRQLAKRLASGRARVEIDELRHAVRICSKSWVGVVQLNALRVSIEPKLVGGRETLVGILEETHGLDSLESHSGKPDLDASGNSLLDLLALLFVEACERLIRGGILSDYFTRRDGLQVVRGRWLPERQILERFGQIDRVICEYDEHERDIPENQILAVMVDVLRRRVSDQGIRRRLGALYGLLASICDASAVDLRSLRESLTYDRLNEAYRAPHALGWLLLDGFGFDDLLRAGRTPGFSFLLDMNRLFEILIGRFLEKLLKEKCRIASQKVSASVIWDCDRRRSYARVIPDYLITSIDGSTNPVAVDAKYKLYDEKKLSMSDVYQAFVYGYAYGRQDQQPDRSVLLYPASDDGGSLLRLQVRRLAGGQQGEVAAFGVPVSRVLQFLKNGTSEACFPGLRELLVPEVLGGYGEHADNLLSA